jgi:hypothetical protein
MVGTQLGRETSAILLMHHLRNVRDNVIKIINKHCLTACMFFFICLALMLNSPAISNTTINSSVQFHCEYACILNAVAAWFIEERIDVDVNSDQILVQRSSNRNEACRAASTAGGDISLRYSEILEINPLISFGHPIPVYCAYILACNNRVECRPRICFSDLVGKFQGIVFWQHCIYFCATQCNVILILSIFCSG